MLAGLGLAACGSTNTAQTVATVTDSVTDTVGGPSTPTVTAPHILSTTTESTTSSGNTSLPETVTTTQITNPSSGGAG